MTVNNVANDQIKTSLMIALALAACKCLNNNSNVAPFYSKLNYKAMSLNSGLVLFQQVA